MYYVVIEVFHYWSRTSRGTILVMLQSWLKVYSIKRETWINMTNTHFRWIFNGEKNENEPHRGYTCDYDKKNNLL